MNESKKNKIGVEKIETLFAANSDFPSLKKSADKKSLLTKVKIRHLFEISRLLFTNTYRVLPKILKDIFFGLSIIHKAPASKMFARTRYGELRILIDVMVSALSLKTVPASSRDEVERTFRTGFYTTKLSDISE